MAKIIEVGVWETLIWLPWVTVSKRRPETRERSPDFFIMGVPNVEVVASSP